MPSQALLHASRSGFQHIPRSHCGGSHARVPREHPEPAAPRAAAPLLPSQPPNSPSVKRASAETASEHRSGSAAGQQSQARRRRGQALLLPAARQEVGAGRGGKGQANPSKAAWALCPGTARRHGPGQVHLDLPNAHTNTEIDSALKQAPGEAFLLHADGKTQCLTRGERAIGRTQKPIFSLTKTSSSADTCPLSRGQLVTTGVSPHDTAPYRC